MTRLHRILFHMLPGPRNEWIRAHHAELEHIPSRRQRWRWTLGLLPLAWLALARQLRHEAGTFLGGTLVKTIVATVSILNLTAGVGLLVLYIIEPGRPLVMLALSGVLLIQGGFTLALILGAFGSHQHAATHLQLAGSTRPHDGRHSHRRPRHSLPFSLCLTWARTRPVVKTLNARRSPFPAQKRAFH